MTFYFCYHPKRNHQIIRTTLSLRNFKTHNTRFCLYHRTTPTHSPFTTAANKLTTIKVSVQLGTHTQAEKKISLERQIVFLCPFIFFPYPSFINIQFASSPPPPYICPPFHTPIFFYYLIRYDHYNIIPH